MCFLFQDNYIDESSGDGEFAFGGSDVLVRGDVSGLLAVEEVMEEGSVGVIVVDPSHLGDGPEEMEEGELKESVYDQDSGGTEMSEDVELSQLDGGGDIVVDEVGVQGSAEVRFV